MHLTIAGTFARRSGLVALALSSGLLLMSACASKHPQEIAAPSQSSGSASPQAIAPTAGAGAAASSQAPPASSQASSGSLPSHEHLAGIGSATIVTIHGKIVSVDRSKKQVTLEGPRGKKVTFEVKNPYNLEAAKPGDLFVAKFYEIVTVRKLRPGEEIPAVVLDQGIVSAAPGQTPGAAAGSSVQVVAKIVAINKTKKTIDLQGPNGVVETVNVASPANLKHVKVGNDLVITLTKVMAISFERETGA